MPRPNLAERLSQLASLDMDCLTRLRETGFCVEIEPNGKIIMKPSPATDTPDARKGRTGKLIDEAYD